MCRMPNGDLARLGYRMQFEDDFRKFLTELDQRKPVIACGDFNVAHQPIDLKNAKANEGNAGYTIEERTKMTELLNSGFIDSFRELYPEKVEYTWWSYLLKARNGISVGGLTTFCFLSGCARSWSTVSS
jgi:exodeoxyribonuclease-3